MVTSAIAMLLQAPVAWIVYDANATRPDATASGLARPLREAGYQVGLVSAGEFALSAKDTGVLWVLANAADLPVGLGSKIDRFLNKGGHLIALKGPGWQRPLVRDQGRWVPFEGLGEKYARQLPARLVVDFAKVDLNRWERASDRPETPTTFGAVQANGSTALHVRIPELTSWDTLMSPSLDKPFASGFTVTQFAAKGGTRTRQLAVEWREQDGSRWIATVPLSTQWQRFRLVPSSFNYWPSNPNRGQGDDRFRPESASQVSFGLAFSHTGTVGGRHEYWVANVGTARAGQTEEAGEAGVSISPRDGLYPHYKYFEITEPVKVQGRPDLLGNPFVSANVTKSRSVQPRPRGVGFDKGRDSRFIPLLEARSSKGEWRGFPAATTLWKNGSTLTGFGVEDPGFYQSVGFRRLVGHLARRLRQRGWLFEGGASAYTVFPDQEVQLGATKVGDGSVRLLLDGSPRQAGLWKATRDTVVAAELVQNGQVVDRLSHPIRLYRPTSNGMVQMRDGDFTLDGKVWRAHGVNYMPSSGIGLNVQDDFEHWIDRRPYDPEIVERDLRKVKDLGMNAISAFIYGRSVPAGNLLDLLRICRELDLKVNLSLRPGTPLDFDWPAVSGAIQTYRLKDEDAVMAYDLAWEPNWGHRRDRDRWNDAWNRWLQKRYGSLNAASLAWGVPLPDGNPENSQFMTDGPHRKMIADYRRFLDDLLEEKYGEATRRVKEIDPNHLVSFRMSEAGNPTFNWDGFLPYDFPGLAKVVDYLAPEAYGRIGGWEQVKPGAFEVAYARAWTPDRPVLWSEVGMSTLDSSRLETDPDLVPKQAEFYRAFYRMLIETHSNGIFWWWYPGGVRVNERSDYGIVNPDGSDRLLTKVIREAGKRFVTLGQTPKPTTWLVFDRDEDARGVFGVYERLKGEYWKRVEAGERVGLRPK